MTVSRLLTVVTVAVLGAATLAWGQRRESAASSIPPNPAYDGRFTFARIAYRGGGMDFSFGGRGGRGGNQWSHDYPRAERNFTTILGELTAMRVRSAESVVLTLDDPALTRYPVAYMAEPGYWVPNEEEVAGLRAYLLKGGLIIFDDFNRGRETQNVANQMARVLPGTELLELPATHPIFDAFYRIDVPETYHPYSGIRSTYLGVFEDNDPTRRLLAIVNVDADIAEYWEFSDRGMFPIDASNTAYKLGVNYFFYALTR
jgi:hypothetical protein